MGKEITEGLKIIACVQTSASIHSKSEFLFLIFSAEEGPGASVHRL